MSRMVQMLRTLGMSVVIAWLQVAYGADPRLDGRAVLIMRRNLRRLQHAEIMATTSNVHVEGMHCALNVTHLHALEMKILSTSVPGCTAAHVCQELMQHGSVEFCEADEVIFHPDHTPNDPLFFHQWGLSMIEAEKAWDRHDGSGGTIVGILDSGLKLDHPDLSPVLWNNPGEIAGNGKDDDNNGWVDDIHGVDVVESDGAPQDCHQSDGLPICGHGTHCAGIVGAAGNNGIGISGVMHGPKIMGLKFLGNAPASGTASLAAQAFDYGITNGAKVTLMSFGNYQHSSSLKYAIERSISKNHIVVASAGNAANNNDVHPSYPCAYPLDNIICVGASHSNDQGGLADFSNYGPHTVDVAAPGAYIKSTWIGPDYKDLSGTSMAAPFVAGLAGLLFDYKPDASWEDVRDAIVNTADVKNFGSKVGCGRINARKAIEALASGQIPRTCNGPSTPAAAPMQVSTPDPTPRPHTSPSRAPTSTTAPMLQKPAPSCPVSACSFEAAMSSNVYCDLWSDDMQAGQFRWAQSLHASTPSPYTGPGHAACGQKFLYTEASFSRVEADLASLKSLEVYLHRSANFSFWYHMHGDAIGMLRVSVLQEGVATVVWNQSGEQGNAWHHAVVNLSQFVSAYVEIIIDGIRGSDWRAAIGIDGLELTSYTLTAQTTAAAPAPVPQHDNAVELSGLSSIIGALRLQLSPNGMSVVMSNEGEAALLRALAVIFGGGTPEILGICNVAEVLGAQCPGTRTGRSLGNISRNTSIGNSSLHIDFRIKVMEKGDDASWVLAEMRKIQSGNEIALSKAAKEIEVALNSSTISFLPVVVLWFPHPLHLEYKSADADAGTDADAASTPTVGAPDSDTGGQEEEESNLPLAMMLSIIGGVSLVLIIILLGLVVLLRRHREGQNACRETGKSMYPCGPSDASEPSSSVLKVEPEDLHEVSADLIWALSEASTSSGDHRSICLVSEIASESLESSNTCHSGFEDTAMPPTGVDGNMSSPMREQLVEIGISHADSLEAAQHCSTVEAAMEWLMANGKL